MSIKDINQEYLQVILDNYEGYLDKKLINGESLSALIRIIEEGNADNVSQAVNIYKEADKK